MIPNIVQDDGTADEKQVVCYLPRNKNNFKYVDIATTQIVPAVEGLTKDVAIEVLEKSGFQTNIKYVHSQEQEDIVLHYSRTDDMTPVIELEVGSADPEVNEYGINPKGEKAYYPIPIEGSSSVKCPKCKSIQPSGRQVCWKCGVLFMPEDDKIEKPEKIQEDSSAPHIFYCKNCGAAFGGTSDNKPEKCPKCNSSIFETTIPRDIWRTLSSEQKIQALFDEGILTQEEYNAKKRKLH